MLKAKREKGGEMTQTLYAHMNKRKKKSKKDWGHGSSGRVPGWC
jgi:hypothetical protein